MLAFSPFRRPSALLKTVFRQTRHQRLVSRALSTETTSSRGKPTTTPPPPASTSPSPSPSTTASSSPSASAPAPTQPPKPQRPKPRIYAVRHSRTLRFALYPPPPSSSVRLAHPDPLPGFHARSIAHLDPTGARSALVSRTRPDAARVGDILLVTPRAGGEPFAGVLVQVRRRGVDTAIHLRGQLAKTGTEMWFKVYSPAVAAVDIVKRTERRARRARLTYLRKPKHDVGSVDAVVQKWRKDMAALRAVSAKGSARGAKRGR